MNSLDSQITALYTLAHELLYLGSDGSPIYSDHFSRLNGDVLSRANTLYPHHGSTDEEEARLCLSLLMGYNATIYNNGDKEVRIQQILNRCWEVLDRLPASLLKVRLLTYCYGEVFDDDLSVRRIASSTAGESVPFPAMNVRLPNNSAVLKRILIPTGK